MICHFCGIELENGDNETIKCEKCAISFHSNCYRPITGNFNENKFTCDMCRIKNKGKISEIKCVLCPNRDGILRRATNRKYVHHVCGMYIPGIKYMNTAKQIGVLVSKTSQKLNNTCNICKNSNGVCIKCNMEGCDSYFHVTCGKKKHSLRWFSDGDTIQYVGYCEAHLNKIVVVNQKDKKNDEKLDRFDEEQKGNEDDKEEINNTGNENEVGFYDEIINLGPDCPDKVGILFLLLLFIYFYFMFSS